MNSSISKACPFCGNLPTQASYGVVQCGQYGATGPFGADDEQASFLWNRRVGETAEMADAVGSGSDEHPDRSDANSQPGAPPPADQGT